MIKTVVILMTHAFLLTRDGIESLDSEKTAVIRSSNATAVVGTSTSCSEVHQESQYSEGEQFLLRVRVVLGNGRQHLTDQSLYATLLKFL